MSKVTIGRSGSLSGGGCALMSVAALAAIAAPVLAVVRLNRRA